MCRLELSVPPKSVHQWYCCTHHANYTSHDTQSLVGLCLLQEPHGLRPMAYALHAKNVDLCKQRSTVLEALITCMVKQGNKRVRINSDMEDMVFVRALL